jgi:DNA-binding HxlR family transcriptional regulator
MEEKKFIEFLGQTGTVRILKTINNSEKCIFTDLIAITSRTTLYRRLKQLTKLNLIKYNMIKEKGKRKEWYETTEKEKKVVKILDQLGKLRKE